MSEDEVAHKRVNEVRPEWAVGDWHCSCGAWGNLGWQGFAFHLSGDVIPALSGVPEGAASDPTAARWAFLDRETGDWIEVESGVASVVAEWDERGPEWYVRESDGAHLYGCLRAALRSVPSPEPLDVGIPRMNYGVLLTEEEQRELDRRLWQIEQTRRQGNAAARSIPLGGAAPPLAAPQPVPEDEP